MLRENDIHFGISCTISPYNIDKPDEILEVMEEYGVRGFGYNLMTENDNIVMDSEEKRLMVKNILSAEDSIIKNRYIEDRIINRRLESFVKGRVWTRDCAGYGNQIVITPKGEVGVCHGLWPDFVNKNVKTYFDLTVDYEGTIRDHPTWIEWFNRTPFNMPQCWDCYGISLCGGGCAKNSLVRKGSIWEVDDDICILIKETVPWVIWTYYDKRLRKL
jgi:uncharacterized protein